MKLQITYKQILAISAPIMLGSAVQNVIALTDAVFLFHLSEEDFAAIGFVGVFYLIISAIGFSLSKGGQIIIARRMGEGNYGKVAPAFYAMLYFEMAVAVLLFVFMIWGCPYFFSWNVQSDVIYQKSLEYLDYRAYGVFFSYPGLAIVALYTGVARTFFIVVDTIILAAVNIVLNYGFIFGKFGLPELGIAGAGLASTIAEATSLAIFLIYIFLDPQAREYRIFHLPRVDFQLIKKQWKIASPIVAQAIVGVGSWFVFFSIVENMGERPLAITNLVRMVYLILSIPCWGFASGINTIVSNLIGQGRKREVLLATWKVSKICFLVTMVISLPVVLFPAQTLYPLLGGEDTPLIHDSQYILFILLGILALFSVAGVFFNGLIGTGATMYGLKMQFLCVLGYTAYIYVVINFLSAGLAWAWASELFYWLVIGVVSFFYIRSGKWIRVVV